MLYQILRWNHESECADNTSDIHMMHGHERD